MKYFHLKFFLLLLVIALCQSSKFWHITDLHLDYLYTAGGNNTNFCHEIIRNNNDTDNETSDVTEYGDYNCDSPKLLVDSALQGNLQN